ncbi:Uncharacterised protein [Raoultella planticola]|nr:Uncharacterised protein [Raoultella planticola]
MKSKRLNPFRSCVTIGHHEFLRALRAGRRARAVAVIAVIIMVSLFQLISIVFTLLVLDAFNPLDHKVFQSVFGMIMTLLIAMEFQAFHRARGAASGQHHPG